MTQLSTKRSGRIDDRHFSCGECDTLTNSARSGSNAPRSSRTTGNIDSSATGDAPPVALSGPLAVPSSGARHVGTRAVSPHRALRRLVRRPPHRSEDRSGRRAARRRRPRHQCPRREPHQRDAHEPGADLRREPAAAQRALDGAAAARRPTGPHPRVRRLDAGAAAGAARRDGREEADLDAGYAEYEPFIVDPDGDGGVRRDPAPSTSTSCEQALFPAADSGDLAAFAQVQSEQLQPLLQILADDLEAEGDAQSAAGRPAQRPRRGRGGHGHHPAARHRARLGRARGRPHRPRRPPAHRARSSGAAFGRGHGARGPDRRHGCAGRRRARPHGRGARRGAGVAAGGPVVGGGVGGRRRGVLGGAARLLGADLGLGARRPLRSPVSSPAPRRRSAAACRPWPRVRSRWVPRSGRSRRTRRRPARSPPGRHRGGDHHGHGREAGRVLGGDRQRRQGDHEHRRADQPAGAERHHRGGAGRRGGQGLRRRRQRGQGAGAGDGEGDRGHRQAGARDPGRHHRRGGRDRGDLCIVAQISDRQTTIASAVEEQTATTSEMSRSVQEAANGTGEIATNITGVSTAAESTTQALDQTRIAVDELSRMAVGPALHRRPFTY